MEPYEIREDIAKNPQNYRTGELLEMILTPGIIYRHPETGWLHGGEFCSLFNIRPAHVANYLSNYLDGYNVLKKDVDPRSTAGNEPWWISSKGVLYFLLLCRKKELERFKEYFARYLWRKILGDIADGKVIKNLL